MATKRRQQGKGKSKSKSKERRGKAITKKRGHKRLHRGGTCYGRGVGANTYDPNDSIYNTNLLKLFPYRPT